MMFGSKTEKITKLAEKKKSDKITSFLNDKDKTVVLAAINGLGDAGGEAGYNALVPLLRNQDAEVRAASATAIGKTGFPQGRTHLSYHLKNEADPKVQDAIRHALDILPESK